jgi:PAS domain S-box-containing protein
MSLRKRFFLLSLAIALAMAGFILFYWAPKTEFQSLKRLETNTHSKLDIISSALIPLILQKNFAAVYEDLGTLLKKNSDWVALELRDAKGRRIFPLGELRPPKGKNIRVYDHKITFSDNPLGTLWLAVNVRKSLAYLKSQQRELTVALIIGVLAAMIIAVYFIERFVSRPAQLLAEAIDRLAQGDYQSPLPETGNDELGRLTASFNKMRKDLLKNAGMIERFGQIMDESVNEIYIFDSETMKFSQVNKGARNNLGYSMEELSKMTPIDIEPEMTEESFHNFVKPLLWEKRPFITFTTVHRRKDGTDYPVEVRLQLSKIIEPPVFVTIIQDITERRETERELLEANENLEKQVKKRTAQLRMENEARKKAQHILEHHEERLRTILETAPDGIITIDQTGIIESINPAAEAIFGYTHDEIIGKNVRVLMAESTSIEHDGYLKNYLRTGKAKTIGIPREEKGKRKNGEVFPLSLTVGETNVRGEVMFTASLRDITERKAIEESLRRAKEKAEAVSLTKSEFVAHMSHECRSPLNAIIGFAESIKRETLGPMKNQEYSEYIDNIHHSGMHLLDLVNDLLDLSAIEAGELKLKDDKISVAEIFKASTDMMQARAKEKHLNVKYSVPEGFPFLRADERRVKQVITNLLSNATKFTPMGGMIALTAEMEPGGVMALAVSDTGVGMDKKEIATALAEFGRVKGTLPRSQEGTGLGLPLCQELTGLHNGKFELQSTPGEGTTVTVRFSAERVLGVIANQQNGNGTV